MKTVFVLLIGFAAGILPLYGQAGSPAPASAPATSVPIQSTDNPRKALARSQKNQRRITSKSAGQDATSIQKPPHTLDQAPSKPAQSSAVNFTQAVKRQHRDRHDQGWWKRRYTTIVFVTGSGYYYRDAGYWFPAFGYDPRYENYEYNGPIYTYGNLLPDQVIYNLQRALKDLGYYAGPLNGSLGPITRAAISAFQEDNGLEVTGVIDAPTVEALGLN